MSVGVLTGSLFLLFMVFLSQRVQLLSALLIVELLVLMLAMSHLCFTLGAANLEAMVLIVILTLGACKAALGLALLTLLTRSSGSDSLKSLVPFAMAL